MNMTISTARLVIDMEQSTWAAAQTLAQRENITPETLIDRWVSMMTIVNDDLADGRVLVLVKPENCKDGKILCGIGSGTADMATKG